MRPQRVFGEDLARALFDQLALHPIVRVLRQADLFGRHDAIEGQALRLQFLHARFDLFEILGSERRLALKVIVEAGVGRRSDA